MMGVGIDTLVVFLPASVAFILAPGPDTVYVLSQALSTGKTIGVRSALGISTGVLIHTFAAVFGLSVILRQSAIAFHLVKWVGALYLIILGIQTLRSPTKFSLQNSSTSTLTQSSNWLLEISNRSGFRRGVFVNVFNPKVALFFLMFLPQFVPPSAPHNSLQMLVLGIIYSLLTLVYLSCIAILSGGIRSMLASYKQIESYLQYGAGSSYIGLGIGLAIERDLLS